MLLGANVSVGNMALRSGVGGGPVTPSAPTNLAESLVEATTVRLTWDVGAGDRTLVVMKAGSAPTAPTDTTAYAANAAFGSGDDIGSNSFVVYAGAGALVNVTALSADTTYYVAAYSYDDGVELYSAAISINYVSASGAPTNVVISAITNTTATVTWDAGSGDRSIVVLSPTPLSGGPADETAYSADANYGDGDAVGNGYATYVGAGTTVNVTGLTKETEYSAAVYSYDDGVEVYSAAAGDNFGTVTDPPTTQISGISWANVWGTSMQTEWSGAGDADYVAVFMKEGGAVDAVPANDNLYAGDTIFGSGDEIGTGNYAIYVGPPGGPPPPIIVTGLTPGTTYHIQAWSFNVSGGANDVSFLFTAPPTDSQASGALGWNLMESQTPSAASVATFSIPTGAEDVSLVYDLDMSADGAAAEMELEIGGSWYALDLAHKNISDSAGATYQGAVGTKLGPTGNAAGENTSLELTIYGVDSTTLYPVITATGGYFATTDKLRMLQGAFARATAGAITGVRISPDSGTFTGEVSLYAFKTEL